MSSFKFLKPQFVFVSAIGFLIAASATSAHASPGCTQFNGTFGPNYATTGSTQGTGFDQGDVLTLTRAFDNGTSSYLSDSQLGTVVAPTTGNFSYTVPATTTSTLRVLGGANLTTQYTVSCVPGGGGAGRPAVSDSQKAQAAQNAVTTAVATMSGATISGAIEGGIADGFGGGGSNFGANGGFISFTDFSGSADAQKYPAQFQLADRGRVAEGFDALAYSPMPTKAKGRTPIVEREWNMWADLRGTGFKADDTVGLGNDVRGRQFNFTAGIGRKLDPYTLVGVVVGYENFKYDVASLGATIKGDGETVGGYFAKKFGNLRFDAAVAWSNVDYSASAGAANGSFVGSRWLFSTGLTGTYGYGAYLLEPSAKIFVLRESQSEWTDSLGVLQASRKFTAGRSAFGSQIGRQFQLANGWTATPYAGLYADWRFSSDNAVPTATPVANISNGWSGRVTAGISTQVRNGVLVVLGSELGGLGTDYKIWSGNVRAVVPF